MSDASQFFFGATGGTIYPTFPAKKAAFFPNVNNLAAYFEGFAGDGDRIVVPGSATTSIDYYNSAGTLQWSKLPSALNAAADTWIGFTLDETDGLIYCVAWDTTVTPYRAYFASINSAGTVTNLGNDVASQNFPNCKWDATGIYVPTLQRESDGSGNFSWVSGGFEFEFNISTGLFVINGSQILTVSGSPFLYGYRDLTTDIFINTFAAIFIDESASVVSLEDPVHSIEIGLCSPNYDANLKLFIPGATGLGGGYGAADNMRLMEWKGDLVLGSNSATCVGGARTFDRAKFTQALSALALNLGVI